ncbi:MAG TPA: rhamnulokinase family protein [Gemmataceae bacterium]|nr:rhamnulokinase family protein [Gemmataceae bacterium]
MPATRKILAFDLGAESGRGVLGRFDGQRLMLQDVHRFPNTPAATLDTLHWDVLNLYNQMLAAMRKCAVEFGGVDSIGVDTWGVDFALLGRSGTLLGNPRHYRDPHTEGVMERAFEIVSKQELFKRTGIQFMRFNSLFQLIALQRDRSPFLDIAETLLFIPDLLHYFFTGIKVNEYTDASTSQMLDPVCRNWDFDLLAKFGLPTRMLGNIVPPGTELGPLRSKIASDTGLSPVPVIAPATHDTGSAVAAVPAKGKNWAFISSGTWSLMGAEIDSPLMNEEVRAANFTNEGGVDGTIRFLKNIAGLWLVQECRRAWERAGQEFSYDGLARLAEAAPPFVSVIDPDHTSFMLPASMPEAIGQFCRQSGQPAPVEPGAVVRCALESLALRYRWVLEKLESLLGRQLETIHIVGGGTQNILLCQLTADACNREILAGPVEATALGNVLLQAVGLKLLGSLEQAREVLRNSFDVHRYEPREPAKWEEPYQRFLRLLS